MEIVYLTVLFLLVMSIASVIGVRHSINSYYEFPSRFVLLYISASVLVLALSNITLTVPSLLIVTAVNALIVVYFILSILWSRLETAQIPGYRSVPESAKAVAKLHPRREIGKLSEILFQDVVAVAIIHQLVLYTYSPILLAGIFTAVVGFVHIPSIRLFGPIYGSFFLFGSVALAPFAFYLVYTYSFVGLFVLFILHVGTYICWYGGLYAWARPTRNLNT